MEINSALYIGDCFVRGKTVGAWYSPLVSI